MGAVSPRQQVFAAEALLQRHSEAIRAVTRASTERHARALSADDAFRLVAAEIEYATMASYWLRLVWLDKRLPKKGRPDLSVSKSRERRHDVLGEIKLACQIASELMADLLTVRRPNETIARIFRKFELQMVCVRITAARHALMSASERKPLSPVMLEGMLLELDKIRLEPGFAERSPWDQDLLWLTTAMLRNSLQDPERERDALKERYALALDDPGARAPLLIEMMDVAESEEEKFALIRELAEVAQSFNPGPPFSRERIGRLSMFRDGLWSVVASVDPASPFAAPIIDEALACHRTWAFGTSDLPTATTIRLTSSWKGGGRCAWHSHDSDHVHVFKLDPELAAAFTGKVPASSAEREPIGRAAQFLDAALGSLLLEATEDKDDVRLQAGGTIALLPLLMTMLDGRPLGAAPNVAYAHPNPDVLDADATSEPYDLLIVDDYFEDHSAKVRSAVQLVGQVSSQSCRVLRFNSATDGTALKDDEFAEALQSASRALMFCHVGSPQHSAGKAAVVIGPDSRFRIDAFAALDLRSLSELAIIGCASGRANPFVGDLTIAHAAAMAGARHVLYTLWPILSSQGASFVDRLVKARADGQTTAGFLADRYSEDRMSASPFAMMRP
jgi:hypothetical protein